MEKSKETETSDDIGDVSPPASPSLTQGAVCSAPGYQEPASSDKVPDHGVMQGFFNPAYIPAGHQEGSQQPPTNPQGFPVVVYNSGHQSQEVVIQQPPMVSITGDDYYKACPDTKRAHKSMIAAIITSLVFALFGCWWALPLTIPAVALGVKGYRKGRNGNLEEAKKFSTASIYCSVFGVIIGLTPIALGLLASLGLLVFILSLVIT